MSKINITCDLCGKENDPSEMKQVEFNKDCSNAIWVYPPSVFGEHFICTSCLRKLGWCDEKELAGTETGKDDGK